MTLINLEGQILNPENHQVQYRWILPFPHEISLALFFRSGSGCSLGPTARRGAGAQLRHGRESRMVLEPGLHVSALGERRLGRGHAARGQAPSGRLGSRYPMWPVDLSYRRGRENVGPSDGQP